MVDTELMGRDPLMGMIVEEVGSNKEVATDINTVVEGSEALDMFMDVSNPYNKTVHAALQTVAEDMKRRLVEKGNLTKYFATSVILSFSAKEKEKQGCFNERMNLHVMIKAR